MSTMQIDRAVVQQALEALDKFICGQLTVGQRYTDEGQQLLDSHAALRAALAQPVPEPVADHFPDVGKMVQHQVAWTDRERRVVRFALKWFISGALQRHAAAAADLRGMWFKPGDDLKFYQDAKDAQSALAKMGAAEPLGAPGGGHSAAPSPDNHSPRG